MENLRTRRKRKKEKNSKEDAGFKNAKKSNDSTSSSDSAELNRSQEKDSRKMAKQKRKKTKYDDSSDEKSARHRKKKSKRSSKHKKKLKKRKKGRKHDDEEKQQTGNEQSSLHSCLLPPKLTDEAESQENPIIGPLISAAQANPEEPKKRSMVPMTKEEYEKQQSVIRRVYDPDTGRNRLIKGDGEVIEEIVSYSRQKQINKQATKGDAASFQKMMGLS